MHQVWLSLPKKFEKKFKKIFSFKLFRINKIRIKKFYVFFFKQIIYLFINENQNLVNSNELN